MSKHIKSLVHPAHRQLVLSESSVLVRLETFKVPTSFSAYNQDRRCITHRRWTALPKPQEVIERVNQLGVADDQPEPLPLYDRKGHLIRDTETPGVPVIVDTNIPDDEDALEDLNHCSRSLHVNNFG